MRRKQRDAYGLPPLGMTREDVVTALGSESIRRQLEAAGELAPFYRRPSFVLYDYIDVVKAFTRLRAGLTSIPLDTKRMAFRPASGDDQKEQRTRQRTLARTSKPNNVLHRYGRNSAHMA